MAASQSDLRNSIVEILRENTASNGTIHRVEINRLVHQITSSSFSDTDWAALSQALDTYTDPTTQAVDFMSFILNWVYAETRSTATPTKKWGALKIKDGMSGGKGTMCVISFPGQHQASWNNIVAWATVMKALDPGKSFFATACVFLPDGDPAFGKHEKNEVDGTDTCYCQKIYGEEQTWGCAWFKEWKFLLEEAHRRGHEPVIVYKNGQVGQGDAAVWEDFPLPFSTEAPGLGGSQRGEVAYARKVFGR